MLNVSEIFKSIQGESTHAGKLCAFVRLAGCNLACTYCDTAYAATGGTRLSSDEICGRVSALGCNLVEITGGEPLIQPETPQLAQRLLAEKHTVLIETNGACDISTLPAGCIRIMDIKCPGSGMALHFLARNLTHLAPQDECKFVITDRQDFEWAMDFIRSHGLHAICTAIFSPNFLSLEPKVLAQWMLEANAPARLGLQIHKYIWREQERGV